jgi:hypothetical protein
MITKPTNAHECIKYIINIAFLPYVLATIVAFLWEANYTGGIYLDITKVCEQTHRCKTLSFKIHNKI